MSEISGSIMSETNDRTTTVNAAASLTYGQPRGLKRTRCGLTSGQRQPQEHYLVTQSRRTRPMHVLHAFWCFHRHPRVCRALRRVVALFLAATVRVPRTIEISTKLALRQKGKRPDEGQYEELVTRVWGSA